MCVCVRERERERQRERERERESETEKKKHHSTLVGSYGLWIPPWPSEAVSSLFWQVEQPQETNNLRQLLAVPAWSGDLGLINTARALVEKFPCRPSNRSDSEPGVSFLGSLLPRCSHWRLSFCPAGSLETGKLSLMLLWPVRCLFSATSANHGHLLQQRWVALVHVEPVTNHGFPPPKSWSFMMLSDCATTSNRPPTHPLLSLHLWTVVFYWLCVVLQPTTWTLHLAPLEGAPIQIPSQANNSKDAPLDTSTQGCLGDRFSGSFFLTCWSPT